MQSVNYPYWVGDVVFLRVDAEQGLLYPYTVTGIEVTLEKGQIKQRFKLSNCTKLTLEFIHDVIDLMAAKKIAIKHINEFEIDKCK